MTARPRKQTLHHLDLPLATVTIAKNFTARDDSRPVLNGVAVEAADTEILDSSGYVYAADGFIAARADIPPIKERTHLDPIDRWSGSVIIPRQTIIAVSRITNPAACLTLRKETDRWFIGQYRDIVTVSTKRSSRKVTIPEVWMTFTPIDGTMKFQGIFDEVFANAKDEGVSTRQASLAHGNLARVVSAAKDMERHTNSHGNPVSVTLSSLRGCLMTTKGDPGVALTMIVMPLVMGGS
jgi:hypothetical protein